MTTTYRTTLTQRSDGRWHARCHDEAWGELTSAEPSPDAALEALRREIRERIASSPGDRDRSRVLLDVHHDPVRSASGWSGV
jgi:hypothetical protein